MMDFFLREKIFKTGVIKEMDRNIHDLKDINVFDYRKYSRYVWYFPKYLIQNLEKIKCLSIHWPENSFKKLSMKKIEYRDAYVRHTRRIMPLLFDRISRRFRTLKHDNKEDLIEERVSKIQQLFNIPKPPYHEEADEEIPRKIRYNQK